MPIPELTKHGFLPLGIHQCELSEIAGRFVYNNHRKSIWNSFEAYLEQLKPIPEINIIYVDGSYTTDKDLPGDVDLIVEIPNRLVQARMLQKFGNIMNRAFVKQFYHTDLLFAYEPNLIGGEDMRDFFRKIKAKDALAKNIPLDSKKGLLKTRLPR